MIRNLSGVDIRICKESTFESETMRMDGRLRSGYCAIENVYWISKKERKITLTLHFCWAVTADAATSATLFSLSISINSFHFIPIATHSPYNVKKDSFVTFGIFLIFRMFNLYKINKSNKMRCDVMWCVMLRLNDTVDIYSSEVTHLLRKLIQFIFINMVSKAASFSTTFTAQLDINYSSKFQIDKLDCEFGVRHGTVSSGTNHCTSGMNSTLFQPGFEQTIGAHILFVFHFNRHQQNNFTVFGSADSALIG